MQVYNETAAARRIVDALKEVPPMLQLNLRPEESPAESIPHAPTVTTNHG